MLKYSEIRLEDTLIIEILDILKIKISAEKATPNVQIFSAR